MTPYPRVFCAKSAQRVDDTRDTRNCELKRVCKRLKRKECVFGDDDRWEKEGRGVSGRGAACVVSGLHGAR
jgi:hypothetical protein